MIIKMAFRFNFEVVRECFTGKQQMNPTVKLIHAQRHKSTDSPLIDVIACAIFKHTTWTKIVDLRSKNNADVTINYA